MVGEGGRLQIAQRKQIQVQKGVLGHRRASLQGSSCHVLAPFPTSPMSHTVQWLEGSDAWAGAESSRLRTREALEVAGHTRKNPEPGAQKSNLWLFHPECSRHPPTLHPKEECGYKQNAASTDRGTESAHNDKNQTLTKPTPQRRPKNHQIIKPISKKLGSRNNKIC